MIINKIYFILLFLFLSGSLFSQIDSTYIGPGYYKDENGKVIKIDPSTQSLFIWGEILNKTLDLFVDSKAESVSTELIEAKAERILAKVEVKKICINKKIKKELKSLRKDFDSEEINKFEYVYLKARLLGISINELEIIDSKIKILSINY